jgi:hypothetical protein
MTVEQRWQLIEEKHWVLAESLESLTRDIHEMQEKHDRLDARERKAREALLSARYRIRHSSGFVTVQVLGIVCHNIYSRDYGANLTGSKQRFRCVNEKTGREIVVKSAAKFRSEVTA